MGNDISEAMGGDFDTSSVEPNTGFDPIPAGWYPVQIDVAEVTETKAKNGKLLALELTVIGEQFAGRKLWPRINLVNPNPKCVEIGMRELAALGLACGLAAITDSSELLGKQIMARVKVKADEGYEPSNDVQGYKAIEGAKPATPKQTVPAVSKQPPTAPKQTAPGKSAGKRPWEK